MSTKKIALMGMMVAIAFVLNFLESLLPISLGVPGIKLGLSNLVVLLCLYECTAKQTFGIALVRILLVGLTFGSLTTMMYSLAGGMLSFFVMLGLKKTKKFSVCGVSIAGGVCHNIGQIIVAVSVLRTKLLIYYLPALLIAGCIAGVAIGFLTSLLQKRLHPFFVRQFS